MKTVIVVPPCDDVTSLSLCNHEETDSRMMLHLVDAYENGMQHCMIEATDAYVVVLMIATAKYHHMEL